ncbi:hypothetical protein [Streptomyces sp. NPDC058766]|uniref:hypothetical protein n=1 Tax=Streptomyces sp. NPDC058766 TaxID=3346630 RepID=UPI0036BFBD28
MTSANHPPHDAEELCHAGTELYEPRRPGRPRLERRRPGRAGAASEAGPARRAHRSRIGRDAPCLTELGLLHPAVDDLHRLEPVAPAVALHRMLRAAARR